MSDQLDDLIKILPKDVRDKAIREAEKILHDPVIKASIEIAKLIPSMVDAIAKVIAEANSDNLPEETETAAIIHNVHDGPAPE